MQIMYKVRFGHRPINRTIDHKIIYIVSDNIIIGIYKYFYDVEFPMIQNIFIFFNAF